MGPYAPESTVCECGSMIIRNRLHNFRGTIAVWFVILMYIGDPIQCVPIVVVKEWPMLLMGGGMVSGYQLTVYIMATYSATGVDLACVYCAHLWHGRIASDHVVHHGTWGPVSTHVFPLMQKGYVLRALFCCQRCHQHKRTWSSSRVLGGHYLVNQKYSTKLIIYVLGWPCSSSNLAPFHIILVAQDGSQLHLCWHFGIAVYQPQQVCRPRDRRKCLHQTRYISDTRLLSSQKWLAIGCVFQCTMVVATWRLWAE